jgi:hypothetical protein
VRRTALGRAIARHLLELNWKVGVIDLPGSGLHRAFPPKSRNTLTMDGDVRDEEAVSDAAGGQYRGRRRHDAKDDLRGVTDRIFRDLMRLRRFPGSAGCDPWNNLVDRRLPAPFSFHHVRYNWNVSDALGRSR